MCFENGNLISLISNKKQSSGGNGTDTVVEGAQRREGRVKFLFEVGGIFTGEKKN